MKTKFTLAILLLAGTGLVACGGKADEHEHGDEGMHKEGHHMQNMTKVVKHDGVQVAFDMMTMENHKKMMQQMNMESMQHGNMNHHIMVTLKDLEADKIIKDATDVKISIDLPDGKKVSGEAVSMSGGGMHHYGKDFNMHGTGKCVVTASFKYAGKAHSVTADFHM